MDFGSGQTPNSSTPFPAYMYAVNQQTQQQQQPASVTHVLALSEANNHQATLPLQLNKIGRLGPLGSLGSFTFGKNSEWGHYDMFGGEKSHQKSHPPVYESRPGVSFPSQNHTQSSSTDSRSMSESSPTSGQQLPAQDSHEMKINKNIHMDWWEYRFVF